MNNGLKKNQRIKKDQEFKRLFQDGVVTKGKYFSLRLWIDPEASRSGQRPKIAVTVSRKISTRATIRNLWRRRIKEIFRIEQERIQKGASLWVRVTAAGKAPAQENLKKEFLELSNKAKSDEKSK